MPGKCRPSLLTKTLENVRFCNLSNTDKACIEAVFAKHMSEDAVEVVRCKDCKHWKGIDEFGDGSCENPDGIDNIAKPDDFCSYGERRKDHAAD